MPSKSYQKKKPRKWEDWELTFLILAYPTSAVKDISKIIKRSVTSIIKKAGRLELKNKLYNRTHVTDIFFGNILYRANKKNLELNITPDYLEELIETQSFCCNLSGLPLYINTKTCNKKRATSTASLDRIDNNKGYIVGNCQFLDKRVNFMKSDMDQQEFIDLCCRVADYYRESNINAN